MAIIKSTAIGKAKGSLGNVTYACVGGDTIGKGKVAFPRNPKTYRQMVLRTKWGNLVNLFQTFTGNLRPSFEQAIGRVSDFNLFIGRNIGGSQVYLTASDAQQGGCVVDAYLITEGSLPSIDVGITSGKAATDISLDGLIMSEETTVGQFSATVVGNNPDYAYGDQISCYIAQQSVNSVTGVPYVTMKSIELTLDAESDELLSDVADAEGFSVVEGKLGASQAIDGGIAWVHSRLSQDGKTQVSTQRFLVTNSVLNTYTSESARTAAIVSYKGNLQRAFLTPDVDVAPATN